MSEWISVKDRLPEQENKVLVHYFFDGETIITDAIFTENEFKKYKKSWLEHRLNPTHWMPLPNPPKDIS